MKKTIKLMTVAVLLIAAVRSEASVGTTFSVSAIGDMKLQIKMTNIQGRATSYIKNEEGKILSKKRFKGDAEMDFIYDVSDLKQGSYAFVLEDEVKHMSVPFEILNGTVEVDMQQLKKTYFPRLVKKDREVVIRLLGDETNDLFIDIKSSNGLLLFHEKIEGKRGLIGKRFKFEPGTYLVSLSSNDYFETLPLTFR